MSGEDAAGLEQDDGGGSAELGGATPPPPVDPVPSSRPIAGAGLPQAKTPIGGSFRQRVTSWLIARGRQSGSWAASVWLAALITWLLVAAALVVMWNLDAALWHWAMEEWPKHWPRVIAAVFMFILLIYLPGIVGVAATTVTGVAMEVTLSNEGQDVARAREHVRETEADAIDRLESTDDAKLLPLLRYSRAQLDAYYAIGLKQTRRSFVNAVVAMWLGFLILIAGVVLYIGPIEDLGLTRPTADFNILILSSAAIVEFIAALFLWVYRSTIGQLTFYYRLQMLSHTAILSFRMATTMTKDADTTKRHIIEGMMNASVTPERPAVIGGRGIAALLGGSGAGKAHD